VQSPEFKSHYDQKKMFLMRIFSLSYGIKISAIVFMRFALLKMSLFYVLGLTLVSAPHLARSYHHLFPLDPFQEIPLEEYKGERYMSFD
jgi:hypothetical protein